MIDKDIYKIWAPTGAKWVDWVRPVPFIKIDENFKDYVTENFDFSVIDYIKEPIKDMAIIVDLPGNDSIKEGIGLAKIGFRPIPLYNGTDEQNGAIATVDNKIIKIGLIKGAIELKKIDIDKNAPPAFLLDTNRLNRYKMNQSVFDNSWDIYDQDFPSVEYFLKNNISKILVIGEKVQEDINRILYKFQKKGIEIYLANKYREIKKVVLRKK